jgi:hypothetical protein
MRWFFIKMFRRFTHPNVALIEMVENLWLSGAISVASELGIADLLKEGNKSIGELAKLTGTLEDPLYRVMRALASNDIFKELKDKCFTLTPLAVAMQDNQMRYFINQHLSKMHFQMFGEMLQTVKTGKSYSELFTKAGLFDHIGESSELNEMFNKAMASTSMMQAAAVLPVFSFNRYKKIIDIGGGQGYFLSTILARYEDLKGVVYDLPHVVGYTQEFFKNHDLADRALAIGGSFFESIPPDGDLYILKNILHDWNDEDCIRILQNLRRDMPVKGRILIIEAVLEVDNNPSFGKMTDLLMMVGMNGRERTRAEYEDLLRNSGFMLKKIYPTISPLSLILAELN